MMYLNTGTTLYTPVVKNTALCWLCGISWMPGVYQDGNSELAISDSQTVKSSLLWDEIARPRDFASETSNKTGSEGSIC